MGEIHHLDLNEFVDVRKVSSFTAQEISFISQSKHEMERAGKKLRCFQKTWKWDMNVNHKNLAKSLGWGMNLESWEVFK